MAVRVCLWASVKLDQLHWTQTRDPVGETTENHSVLLPGELWLPTRELLVSVLGTAERLKTSFKVKYVWETLCGS